MKKPLSFIIFSQNGMRQAEKQRKKKFSPEFCSHSARAKKFRKRKGKKIKKLKNLFPALFLASMGMGQAEKLMKKIQSRIPFILYLGKKIRKKIEKTKKPLSGIIYSQNEMRKAEKEKKNLVSNSVHTRHGQENSEKNRKKIQKIKNPISGIIFSQYEMR